MKNDIYIDKIKQIKFRRHNEEYLYEKIVKKRDLTPESVNFFNDIITKMKIDFVDPEARIIK